MQRCEHIACDVFALEPFRLSRQAVVALHACGDLNRHLLQLTTRARLPFLALAPCCHHKALSDGGRYRPLSRGGQSHDLQLDQVALRLTDAQESVAPGRTKRLRYREQLYRLALDRLLKQAGKAVYTPLPPFPARWLRDSFEVFCVHMQRAHALVLPQRPDFQEALRQVQARLISVRALGLLRAVFRRPIELWLVLDRVCYLQEHGFDVQLGTFCPPSITPRNLLIIAQKA